MPMNQVTTRKATLDDLDTLLEFEQGIITAERPFDETLREGEIHYYDIAEMIAADDVEVMVAEIDGELAGSGYARIEDVKPYLKHRQHAYLGFMYVKPEYRGMDVNKKIIEALAEWAQLRGITELRLEVYADNFRAVKAYEKAGFTPILVWMRKDIAEKPSIN
jgi:GNAT superfamily N-acetyltransferase